MPTTAPGLLKVSADFSIDLSCLLWTPFLLKPGIPANHVSVPSVVRVATSADGLASMGTQI
jgi:hypothetical protein